jgi:AbrB family looped-hinge helix DNA binding protein
MRRLDYPQVGLKPPLGKIGMKSMKKADSGCVGFSDAFYGSSTIGERGQVVIPAEARAELGFHPGEKILFMRHPIYKGIMMFKIEALREFLDEFAATLTAIEAVRKEEPGAEE